jgi:hypothetical protein
MIPKSGYRFSDKIMREPGSSSRQSVQNPRPAPDALVE